MLQRVSPPLRIGDKGDQVVNLQDSLRLLVEKDRLKIDDPSAKEKLLRGLSGERDRQIFGDNGTLPLVSMFQEQRGLSTTGEIDESTAEVLNKFLSGLGALADAPQAQFLVHGHLTAETPNVLRDIKITAWSQRFCDRKQLGEATLNVVGDYLISYLADAEHTGEQSDVNLLVIASDAKGTELARSPVILGAKREERVDLVIPSTANDKASEREQVLEAVKPLLAVCATPLQDLQDTPDDPALTLLAREARISHEAVVALAAATRVSLSLIESTTRSEAANRKLGALNKEPSTKEALSIDTTMALFYGCFRSAPVKTLPALLQSSDEHIADVCHQAVMDKLIQPSVEERLPAFIELLHALRIDEVLNSPPTNAQNRSFNAVVSATVTDPVLKAAIADLAVRHGFATESFWTVAAEDERVQKSALTALTTAVGFLDITGGDESLLAAVASRLTETNTLLTPEALVAMSSKDWERIIPPPQLAAQPPDETAVATYQRQRAAEISNNVERAYSTHAFRQRLIADQDRENPVVKGRDDILAFLANNSDFDLLRTPVAGLLTGDPDKDSQRLRGIGDKQATVALMSAYQRLYRLADNGAASQTLNSLDRHSIVKTLLDSDIESTIDLAAWPRSEFVNAHRDNFGAETAGDLYDRAVITADRSLLHSIRVRELADPTFAVVLPKPATWAQMFGPVELCECQHCSSMLSPGAYLFDTLRFLSSGDAVDGRTPLERLVARRPDLQYIALTCANTNVRLPYIDLVNEVLEQHVAPEFFRPFSLPSSIGTSLDRGEIIQGLRESFRNSPNAIELGADAQVSVVAKHRKWKFSVAWNLVDGGRLYYIVRGGNSTLPAPSVVAMGFQTIGTEQERRVAPAHVIDQAYDKLSGSFYPWILPFDLPFEEARAYLSKIGLSFSDILAAFGVAGLPAAAIRDDIAATDLNLSAAEWEILTGLRTSADPPVIGGGDFPEEFWGFRRGIVSPAGPWYVQLRSVLEFLRRSEMQFVALLELLNCYVINPVIPGPPSARKIVIQSTDANDPATCELDKLILSEGPSSIGGPPGAGLEAADLKKIHLFLRLQRKVGWHFYDLDRALAALGNGSVGRLSLMALAQVERLRRATGLEMRELLSWWSDIDSRPYRDYQSPEQTLIPSLYEFRFRKSPYVAVPDAVFVEDIAALGSQISAHAPALCAGLGIKEPDLERLRTDLRVLPAAQADTLNQSTLSSLFRYASFAHASGLSVENLLSLMTATGIEPFTSSTTASAPARVQQTLQFLDIASRARSLGFTAAELAYLMQDRGELRAAPALTDDEAAGILERVRLALQQQFADTQYPSDAGADVVARELVKLGQSPDDAARLGRFFAGTEVYESPLTVAEFGATQLPDDSRVSFETDLGRLRVTGVLSGEERDFLSDSTKVPGATNAYRAAVASLFEQPRTFASGLVNVDVAVPTLSTELSALPQNWTPSAELAGQLSFDAANHQLSFRGNVASLDKTTFPANTDLKAAIEKFVQHPPPPDVRIDPKPEANRFFSTEPESQAFLQSRRTIFEGCRFALDRIGPLVWLMQSPPTARQALASAIGMRDTDVEAGSSIWRELIFDSTAGAPDTRPSAFVSARGPITSDTYPKAFAVVRRLHKVRILLQRLALPAWTSAWLIRHSRENNGPDFTRLPAALGDTQLDVSFLTWITDFARVDAVLSNKKGELTDLLDIARRTSDVRLWLDAVTTLTPWKRAEVEALIQNEVFPTAFQRFEFYERLVARMSLVLRSGVSATTLLKWYRALITTSSGTGVGPISNAMARQIKSAVQARLQRQDWLDISQTINDILRERRRDALASYLISTVTLPGGLRLENKNDLFRYLLIDTEMGACMLTSRIKLAISSVQTFVQRGLLNLEPGVQLSRQNARDWEEFRKQYRIWEANKKVLLYPENWLEPEFRLDKSEIFRQLESDLLSTEVTSDAGRLALRKYIEELADLSGLDVVSAWATSADYAADQGGPRYEMVVIGRTSSLPHVYYEGRYVRQSEQQPGEWVPWQRINLDIDGDHVAPVLWRGTRYLFWATLSEDETSVTGTSPNAVASRMRVKLSWSKRDGASWTPARRYARDPVSITRQFGKPNARMMFMQAKTGFYTRGNAPEPVPELVIYETEDRRVSVAFGNLDPRTVPPDQPANLGTSVDAQISISVMVENPQGSLTPIAGASFTVLRSFPLGDVVIAPRGVTPGAFVKIPSGTYILKVDVDAATYYVPQALFTLAMPTNSLYIWTIIFTRKVATQPPDTGPDRLLDMGSVGSFLLTPLEDLVFVTDPSRRNLDMPGNVQAVGTWFTEVHKYSDDTLRLAEIAAPVFRRTPEEFALVPLFQPRMSPDETSYFFKCDARQYQLTVPSPPSGRAVRLQNFFHPHSGLLLDRVTTKGSEGALDIATQSTTDLTTIPVVGNRAGVLCGAGFNAALAPQLGVSVATAGLPSDQFDFDRREAYASYNWELFFHVPLLIAKQLLRNQRFAEARWWMHRIFDPTSMEPGLPAQQQPLYRFWRFKPFRDIARNPPATLADLIRNETELSGQLEAWANSPFDSFAVARHRPSAFMKAAVTTYLDILLGWGDQLFQRDTIEAMNEATQLYLLAAEILGERPQRVPTRANPAVQTFASLSEAARNSGPAQGSIGAIAVEISSFIDPSASTNSSNRGSLGSMLYFCLNENSNLLSYWERVEDRLFKLRQCLDIEGRFRVPALFEPPIDPALLIRAKAVGLSPADMLADLYAPLPHYRFAVLSQKATELCNEVKALGTALLAAMEKRDAEALLMLRQRHELAILGLTTFIKEQQVLEAQNQIEGLSKSRELIAERYRYYRRLLGDTTATAPKKGEDAGLSDFLPSTVRLVGADDAIKRLAVNEYESDELVWMDAATNQLWISQVHSNMGGFAHMQPSNTFSMGIYSITFGGSNIGAAADSISRFHATLSANATHQANKDALMGGFARRQDEWSLQANLAAREFAQIDKQTAAAEIRQAILEKERLNHLKQIEQAQEIDEFIRIGKFTNEQLYDWMVGQISTLYFQSHQLAYKLARRAEKAYQFELGMTDVSFIDFGSWDTLRRGLLAGERLFQDVKRMEVAFLENNAREYEITKSVSLLSLDPLALIQLKATGECTFDIPELAYDLDYPGHYLRRIKNVGVTIPCVVGPYAGVNCTLTLLSSSVRTTAEMGANALRNDFAAAQSIVTTTAQNDSGLFETNLRDERYLPFEGAGAISTWRLEMPARIRQFDYDTISDVILHIRYTARNGGQALRDKATQNLNAEIAKAKSAGMVRLFSVRHQFPSEWAKFKSVKLSDNVKTAELSLQIREEHYPYWSRGLLQSVEQVEVLAKVGADVTQIKITSDAAGLGATDPNGTGKEDTLSTWVIPGLLQGNLARLKPDAPITAPNAPLRLFFDTNSLEELWLAVGWGGGPPEA